MGLASLYNVPGTPSELDDWAFAHMASHRDIIKAIAQRTGQQLTEYSLDPVPVSNMSTWLYHHQVMHNEMNAAFGLSGFNLTNININDDDSLAGFILANAIEHAQIFELLAQNPTLTSNATFRDSADGSIFNTQASFTLSFGPASTDRYLVAAWGYTTAGSNPPAGVLDDPFIGGVRASILAQAASFWSPAAPANNINIGAMVCAAYVPSGTTGTVTANIGSGGNNQEIGFAACSVYSMAGLSSTNPTQVANSTASAPNAIMDVAAQKAVIGVAMSAFMPGSPGSSWTGLSEDVARTLGGGGSFSRFSSAHFNTTESITLDMECQFSPSAEAAGCFVAF